MDFSMLDGDVAQAFQRFPVPSFDLADPSRVRSDAGQYVQLLLARPQQSRTGVEVEDRLVDSLIDEYSIAVRVYRPAGAASGRGHIHMHGGAFVVGDLEIEDEYCYWLAKESESVVVSVDYRLAPEHPFPAGLEDSYSVLLWVAANADELGIDRQRLSIGGNSAGGALAAGVALLRRERNGPELALQMLLCPILDASMTAPSAANMPEHEFRNAEQMWEHYLAGSPRAQAVAPASPAAADDLTGLPPAYILAAEFDSLRDEAIAYSQRLSAVGVSAELHVWPRVPHAFFVFAPDATISRQAVSEHAAVLRRVLGDGA